MDILKDQSGTSSSIAEENDQGQGYSKFVFYGIHTLKFVDRVNDATSRPVALSGMPAGVAVESEVIKQRSAY